MRQQTPGDQKCDWFSLDGKYRPRSLRSLEGDPKWIDDINPARIRIELNGRLVPDEEAEDLVRSGDDVFASRIPWRDSQILLIANGSSLLNLPLVNREHRKLAGHLIDMVGPPRKTVVFLESGAGGPPIRDKDPEVNIPTGLEIFLTWPANWILFHFAFVGILFCYWRFPIFGPPLAPAGDSPSDFSKHIQAVAELLARSGDRVYAWSHLTQYRGQVGKQAEKTGKGLDRK